MSHASLTARYRPQTFAAVAGQETVKAILSRAAQEDKVAPAYLFSGTRGVGKTTIARIFAKTLNCATAPTGEPCNQCEQCRKVTQGIHVDVVEIDGASNRGIDDAKRLKESIGYAPMEGRYKVFIIDEAHMLTREAFNALLKTLEEPPARVTFILATTEPHKFPVTIISRCQHFTFTRLSEGGLEAHLANVLNAEGIDYEPAALRLIARRASGSVRDSMSLLGQVIALGEEKLSAQSVRGVLGLAGQDFFLRVMEALATQDCLAVSQVVRELLNQGVDIGFFLRELINTWRNLFMLRQAGEGALPLLEYGDDPSEARQWMLWAERFEPSHIHACWQMTLDGQRRVLTSLEPAMALELLLLNLALLPRLMPVAQLQPSGKARPVPPVAPITPATSTPFGQSRGGVGHADTKDAKQLSAQSAKQSSAQDAKQMSVQDAKQMSAQSAKQSSAQDAKQMSAQDAKQMSTKDVTRASTAVTPNLINAVASKTSKAPTPPKPADAGKQGSAPSNVQKPVPWDDAQPTLKREPVSQVAVSSGKSKKNDTVDVAPAHKTELPVQAAECDSDVTADRTVTPFEISQQVALQAESVGSEASAFDLASTRVDASVADTTVETVVDSHDMMVQAKAQSISSGELVSAALPSALPEALPSTVSDAVPSVMPEMMSESMPESVSGSVPVVTSEVVPKRMPDAMSSAIEIVPDVMSDIMPSATEQAEATSEFTDENDSLRDGFIRFCLQELGTGQGLSTLLRTIPFELDGEVLHLATMSAVQYERLQEHGLLQQITQLAQRFFGSVRRVEVTPPSSVRKTEAEYRKEFEAHPIAQLLQETLGARFLKRLV